MACDTLLEYPDFDEEFKIHNDAINSQLGSVISQKGKLFTLYSIKLSDNNKSYKVTEYELLSIIETLK